MRIRAAGASGTEERAERTRDVSFRGVFFHTEHRYEAGEPVEFVLTLPNEVTLAGDVKIRCFGHVVRVQARGPAGGVAARIERYEFLPPS